MSAIKKRLARKKSSSKKQIFSYKNKDYIIYTIIAFAIVIILGLLFFFNTGVFEDSVPTENFESESAGQVSITVLPAGSEVAMGGAETT